MRQSALARPTVNLLLVALVIFGGVPWSELRAQNWPQRPVKVVVPFSAGGNADTLARMTAERLARRFHQPFFVENRLGANGAIAAEAVAKSPRDGHTLFLGGTSVISINPQLSKVPYDPLRDFAPISGIGSNGAAMVINKNVPAKTLSEFIAYLKARPDKLAFGAGGGPGSFTSLFMSLLLKRAGVEMTPVSYRGTAPALTDVIAGHIPTMFALVPEALAQAENVRIVAVSTPTRIRQNPDIPTVAETYPGLVGESWNGYMAPTGTPKEIIEAIASELKAAANDPAFAEELDKLGVTPMGESPAEFAAMIATEVAFWAAAIKTLGPVTTQ